MRRKHAEYALFSDYAKNNRMPLAICMLSLLLSICAGSVYCVFLSADDALIHIFGDLSALKQNLFSRDVFIASASNALRFSFFLWLCGLGRFGIVAAPVLLASKGFACSFSIASLITVYGLAGLGVAAASILPHMLITFICAIIFCVGAINQAIYSSRCTDKTQKRQHFISYCIFCMMLLCVFILCSLFESYISPYLMTLILGI